MRESTSIKSGRSSSSKSESAGEMDARGVNGGPVRLAEEEDMVIGTGFEGGADREERGVEVPPGSGATVPDIFADVEMGTASAKVLSVMRFRRSLDTAPPVRWEVLELRGGNMRAPGPVIC